MSITSGEGFAFGAHFDELRADLAGNAHCYRNSASLFEAVQIITGVDLDERLRAVGQNGEVVPFYNELCRDIGPAHLLLLGVLTPSNYEASSKHEFWPWDTEERSANSAGEETNGAELTKKEVHFLESLFKDQVATRGLIAVLDTCRAGLSRLPPAVGRIANDDLGRYFGFELPKLVQMEFEVMRGEGLPSSGPLIQRHSDLVRAIAVEL